MWPSRVSNPGPLALESDALPTALANWHSEFFVTARKRRLSSPLLSRVSCLSSWARQTCPAPLK